MRSLRVGVLLIVLAAAAVVDAGSVQAKGPVARLAISGPGLDGTVEVDDPAYLGGLSFGDLEQFGKPLDTLPPLGEGYAVARYLQEEGHKPFIFDRIHYFPSLSNEIGYIYFDGLEGNAWSDYDGNWYRATARGDAAIQRLLAKLITVKTEQPQTPTALSEAPSSCKAAAKLETAVTGDQQGVKIDPSLWVGGFQGPMASLKLAGDIHKRSEHGWTSDLHWVSKSNNRLFTIWVRGMDDNSQLWFSLPDQPPSAVLSFNPALTKAKTEWSEFEAKIYVPKAGCYELSVYTQGRKTPERFIFGAGS